MSCSSGDRRDAAGGGSLWFFASRGAQQRRTAPWAGTAPHRRLEGSQPRGGREGAVCDARAAHGGQR